MCAQWVYFCPYASDSRAFQSPDWRRPSPTVWFTIYSSGPKRSSALSCPSPNCVRWNCKVVRFLLPTDDVISFLALSGRLWVQGNGEARDLAVPRLTQLLLWRNSQFEVQIGGCSPSPFSYFGRPSVVMHWDLDAERHPSRPFLQVLCTEPLPAIFSSPRMEVSWTVLLLQWPPAPKTNDTASHNPDNKRFA